MILLYCCAVCTYHILDRHHSFVSPSLYFKMPEIGLATDTTAFTASSSMCTYVVDSPYGVASTRRVCPLYFSSSSPSFVTQTRASVLGKGRKKMIDRRSFVLRPRAHCAITPTQVQSVHTPTKAYSWTDLSKHCCRFSPHYRLGSWLRWLCVELACGLWVLLSSFWGGTFSAFWGDDIGFQ